MQSTDADARYDNRLANKLFLKVADLAALEGEYQQAIGNFEKVANSSVNNNLMKWSVKDYFLKAGMCHLASQVSCIILFHHEALCHNPTKLALSPFEFGRH